MATHDNTGRRAGYVFVLIFGFLAAGIVAGGLYLSPGIAGLTGRWPS